MKTWTTQTGKEIPYSKLKDSHLLNILRFVKDIAKKMDGEVINGGGEFDGESVWYSIGDEQDWLRKFDFEGLFKEAKRRKLIKLKG